MDMIDFAAKYNSMYAEVREASNYADVHLSRATEDATFWAVKFSRNPITILRRDNETGVISRMPHNGPRPSH